ncbi:hypothetical protein, conserved [Leishmania tarentolae]|uniref:Uncharacterized protein n=1 Tax=Leishmania tarentolae TaxID=5689 RepID=A0A640KDW8_LEITA|nr:hypothetical protein, conserved [Leishmania tarentolae]
MASLTSPSPTAAEQVADAPQESLEEAYVRLNTQLLLQLQRLDTAAALRTAEVLQDMLLKPLSSTAQRSGGSGIGNGVAVSPSGSDLFHGSPAEQLLQLRGELQTLVSAASIRAHRSAGFDEDNGSQSTSTETSSRSSTDESSCDDDDDDDDDETEDTELIHDSEIDEDVEETRELAVGGGSNGPQQQQAEIRLLAEALKSWSKVSMEAACASPTEGSCAVSGVTVATSSPVAAQKKRASKPGALQPHPPPPRCKPGTIDKTDSCVAEVGRCPTMPSASSPPPLLPGEGTARVTDDEGLDAEAEAVWVRMQAQVVKEMDRLAIVRKHR